MAKSRWTGTDYRNFRPGDIICNADGQDFLRLVIKVGKDVIWCVGLVHAALTENNGRHPIFSMEFADIADGCWDKPLKLGNLDNYREYIDRVKDECK